MLNIELIICDEMHNLLKYMGIEHGRNLHEDTEKEVWCCATAFSTLMNVARVKAQSPLLIIMTATPNTLLQKMDEFRIPYELFNYTCRVHCDETYVRRYYVSLESVLTGLKRNERAIVYIPTIHLMKEYASKVGDGRKTCCLWGKNNIEHELSEEQLKVRNEILTTKRIPEDVDLLFINAAYETCINIENEDFNTMIMHITSGKRRNCWLPEDRQNKILLCEQKKLPEHVHTACVHIRESSFRKSIEDLEGVAFSSLLPISENLEYCFMGKQWK